MAQASASASGTTGLSATGGSITVTPPPALPWLILAALAFAGLVILLKHHRR